MVRMISPDGMYSENIWFKWSENRSWKTGDLVGPGDPGGPSVSGGSGGPGGPGSVVQMCLQRAFLQYL